MEKLSDIQLQCVNFLKGGVNALTAIQGKTEEENAKKILSSIPRFKEEYSGEFVCLYAGYEQSRFDANEQVLAMYLFSEEHNKGDWYRLSTSITFDAKNNRIPLEKTVETLRKVIDLTGNVIDFAFILKSLAGRKFPAWINERETRDGRKFFTVVSIGSGFDIPKPLPIPQNIDLGNVLRGMSITPADIPNISTAGQPAAAFPAMPPAFAPQQQPTQQPMQQQPQQPTQAAPTSSNPWSNV